MVIKEVLTKEIAEKLTVDIVVNNMDKLMEVLSWEKLDGRIAKAIMALNVVVEDHVESRTALGKYNPKSNTIYLYWQNIANWAPNRPFAAKMERVFVHEFRHMWQMNGGLDREMIMADLQKPYEEHLIEKDADEFADNFCALYGHFSK